MAKTYTTKTAALKATTADIRKLNIDGNPFSKVVSDNVPETPTENDIWKYAVTTDSKGVVTITDDVTVDYTELTDAQKDILKTTVKVIDNKVLDADDTLLMNWDTKNFTNENNSIELNPDDMLNIFGGINDEQKAPITEWNSDLSSLTNGMGMFYGTPLQSFSGDLSSLIIGMGMFSGTALQSFNGDLSSLESGMGMFAGSALESFSGDLSSLIDGSLMFYRSALESFNGDLSSLTNGTIMFFYCPALKSFNGDMPNLTNGYRMFDNCSSLQSFSGDLSNLTNGYRMFTSTALQSFSGDLSSLTDSYLMFLYTPLESFNGDLSSLENGSYMFAGTALESFNGDLSSLENGSYMFSVTPLQSFSGDLPNLINGMSMFLYTALASFSGDLSSLTDGDEMFYNTALASFSGDLSSLENGNGMFNRNQPRHYRIKYYKIVDGVKTWVTETFVSTGLKSFISNLSSLKCGHNMFGNGSNVTYTYTDDSGSEITETTTDVVPLNEESIMLIADTINDISSLDKTVDSNWTYTSYYSDTGLATKTISSKYRGVLHLGYDSSITDTTNINAYCDQIAAKGWTVYLNGSEYVSTASDSASLIDDESSTTPIPHYYKPIQVTDEEIAEYVDANNNYYIIIGGQRVFGDDISTYGMFTSYQHAIQEITTGLGLTKYEKPSTENSDDN